MDVSRTFLQRSIVTHPKTAGNRQDYKKYYFFLPYDAHVSWLRNICKELSIAPVQSARFRFTLFSCVTWVREGVTALVSRLVRAQESRTIITNYFHSFQMLARWLIGDPRLLACPRKPGKYCKAGPEMYLRVWRKMRVSFFIISKIYRRFLVGCS